MNNPNLIILSLDLSTKTGWALSNKHGRILSGTAYFRPRRFEGSNEDNPAQLLQTNYPITTLILELVLIHANP